MERERICPYLQYTAAMQLSQLENASFTLVMLDSALDIKLLLSNADCKLLAIIPPTPPLTLLAIATSMEGMMGQTSAAQFGRISEFGNSEKSRRFDHLGFSFAVICQYRFLFTTPLCPFRLIGLLKMEILLEK